MFKGYNVSPIRHHRNHYVSHTNFDHVNINTYKKRPNPRMNVRSPSDHIMYKRLLSPERTRVNHH